MKVRDMHPETLRHLASDLDEQAKYAEEQSQHFTDKHSMMQFFWDGIATRAKTNARDYRRKAKRAEREQKKGAEVSHG